MTDKDKIKKLARNDIPNLINHRINKGSLLASDVGRICTPTYSKISQNVYHRNLMKKDDYVALALTFFVLLDFISGEYRSPSCLTIVKIVAFVLYISLHLYTRYSEIRGK